MKNYRKAVSAILCFVLFVTMGLYSNGAKVKAAQTGTEDSWVDPGNYTKGWYDVVSDLDIYGNEGTEEDPYEIKNAKDLAGLAYYSNIAASDSATTDFSGKFIEVKARTIDLSAHYWYPVGAVQNFKGTVDGNGVTIQNLYIGREERYEACGKVGLFGSIFAEVRNIIVKNAKVYSNSGNAGGFVGYWAGGTIENCSVEGVMHQASSGNAGGFIGSQTNAGCKVKKCNAKVSIMAKAGTSTDLGGFAGCCNGSTFTDCLANGSVTSSGNSSVGGFVGGCDNGVMKQCSANGNVKTVTGDAGGFIGAIRIANVTNSFATGNVEAGTNRSTAGFIGFAWNYSNSPSVSMKIENCYAAGSTKAGAGSTVAGFFGSRQYGNTSITFKKCYWNLSACQLLDGIQRAKDAKVAVAYMECRTAVGTYKDYMKSADFVSDLNEYVHQNPEEYCTWAIDPDINNNYPYLTTTKESLILNGSETELSVSNTKVSQSTNVYGTLVFPEPESSKKPEPSQKPDEPEDPPISVGLKWGSLEYVYTAGEYNEETKEYADGAWKPKKEGETDQIVITNKTDADIQVSYEFLASTEGSGNFADLTGTFVQEDRQTPITDSVTVRGKQGDINGVQKTFLKINGVPKVQESITVPEVIGSVAITISKSEIVKPEPSQEVVESEKPEVVESEEPEPSQEVVISETPAESAQPESTEETTVSEAPSVETEPSVEPVPSEKPEETSQEDEITEEPSEQPQSTADSEGGN